MVKVYHLQWSESASQKLILVKEILVDKTSIIIFSKIIKQIISNTTCMCAHVFMLTAKIAKREYSNHPHRNTIILTSPARTPDSAWYANCIMGLINSWEKIVKQSSKRAIAVHLIRVKVDILWNVKEKNNVILACYIFIVPLQYYRYNCISN